MTLNETTALVANALAFKFPNAIVATSFLPEVEAANVAALTIFVLPAATTRTDLSRTVAKRTHEIQIAVLLPLRPGEEDEAIAEALDLIESVADVLETFRTDDAHALAINIDPLYSMEHARNAKLFVAVIHLDVATYV